MLLLQLASPQLRPCLSAAMPAAVCACLCAGPGLRSLRDSAGFVWGANAGRALHAAAAMVIG